MGNTALWLQVARIWLKKMGRSGGRYVAWLSRGSSGFRISRVYTVLTGRTARGGNIGRRGVSVVCDILRETSLEA
jgi:hypothetical protein